MLDTDFICWKTISNLLDGPDAAAIHREDIMPSIYPDQTAFAKTEGFPLDSFDWTVQPFSLPLAYFGGGEVPTVLHGHRHPLHALLTGCRRHTHLHRCRAALSPCLKKHAHAAALSDLPALFGGAQNGYFTHIWGFAKCENPKL